MFYVAKEGKNIVGTVTATLVKPAFFIDPYCVEIGWHCKPKLSKRNKYIIMELLLMKLIEWAKLKKAKNILISTELENPIGKLLISKGFYRSEINYKKVVG